MADSNYIGSKLSLISKSDIRYVGTLQNVDTQTSSLVLGQVQSFGTEGRRGGSHSLEIPPSFTIFEYIVFRGADVKDLKVFEAPPSALSSTIDGTRYPPLTYYPIPYPPMTYPIFPPNPSLDSNLAPPRSVIAQVPEMELHTTGHGDKHLVISKPDTKDSPIASFRTIPDPLDTASNTAELDGLTGLVDDLDIGNMKDLAPTDPGTTMATLKNTTSTKDSGFLDFDFASSNAKFIKQAEEETTLDSVFYDKNSFFDNISCDAKDRHCRKKKTDENQLNLETFGQSFIHQGRRRKSRAGSRRNNDRKRGDTDHQSRIRI